MSWYHHHHWRKMQVHLSSLGWRVWPESWALDTAAVSFPSVKSSGVAMWAPAHTHLFDLLATDFGRVQMQPRKVPTWNSFCKIWVQQGCFSSGVEQGHWLCVAKVPSPRTAYGLLGDREGFLSCAGIQNREEHAQAFTESKLFPPEVTVTLTGICHSGHRSQVRVVALWENSASKETSGLIHTRLS